METTLPLATPLLLMKFSGADPNRLMQLFYCVCLATKILLKGLVFFLFLWFCVQAVLCERYPRVVNFKVTFEAARMTSQAESMTVKAAKMTSQAERKVGYPQSYPQRRLSKNNASTDINITSFK